MTADFAFSSYPPKNIFSLIDGKLIFCFLWFSLVIIIYLAYPPSFARPSKLRFTSLVPCCL